MQQNSFSLNAQEQQSVAAAKKEHKCSDALTAEQFVDSLNYLGGYGPAYSYVFTPGPIGTSAKLVCSCGWEKDVTDYDSQ